MLCVCVPAFKPTSSLASLGWGSGGEEAPIDGHLVHSTARSRLTSPHLTYLSVMSAALLAVSFPAFPYMC